MFYLLLFLQLIWAGSYVGQKLALAEMPLGLVLILRYGIATLAFLLAGQLKFSPKFSKREWGLILFVGVLNFSGSPFFQLSSLKLTTATDVSILVAFEPLIAALFAAFFLKERANWTTWITFFIATAGVIIMSGWKGDIGSLDLVRLFGDFLFLVSLFCEASSSTAGRHLTKRHNPFPIIAWMILFGFLGNFAGNWPLLRTHYLAAIDPTGWIALLFLGLFCSAFAYAAWIYCLSKIPVNQLSLSLFLQPIFGSFLAYFLLKERPNVQTFIGGLLVLSTLFVWLWSRLNSRNAALRGRLRQLSWWRGRREPLLSIAKDKKHDTRKEDKVGEPKDLVAEIHAQ